jgi:hypothetical protein
MDYFPMVLFCKEFIHKLHSLVYMLYFVLKFKGAALNVS